MKEAVPRSVPSIIASSKILKRDKFVGDEDGRRDKVPRRPSKRMVYPMQLRLNGTTNRARMGSWCDGEFATHQRSDCTLETSNKEISGMTDKAKAGFGKLERDIRRDKITRVVTTAFPDFCGNNNGHASRIPSNGHLFIQERLHHLVRSFRERALQFRRHLDVSPSPSSTSDEQADEGNAAAVPSRSTILMSGEQPSPLADRVDENPRWKPMRVDWKACFDPQSRIYIYWLLMVTLCFVYNCCVIPLRSTFSYQTAENTYAWFACDYIADVFYLVDMLFVRPRVKYLEDGFWVEDPKLMRRNYMKRWQFKMDILSLLPLDILYYKYGYFQALLRLPRFFKVQTFWELCNRMDSVLSNPYVVRIARTLSYMLYLIHVNACAYYAFSAWEGLGSNGWVFNGIGNAYIRCFYFATKTATSIGKNPKPENEYEYLFMTASWLMGVFVFALLIGQIRDIITTATYTRTEYRKLMDETLEYMRRLSLPQELLERVKLWFTFTWEQQHTLDERRILDSLPIKMKTDVAINVHVQTLNKVQLFHDCDEALLRELVLKLRPVIYLPGDTVCRKGEVGKEMYIVKTGQVQVLGGPGGDVVLATLAEGSVFGEISLLALNGGNRRTADVRSLGFSNLFVLSKSDLNEAIEHYPDARELLKMKARHLIRRNAARERAFTGPRNEAVATTGRRLSPGRETRQLRRRKNSIRSI